MKAILVDSNVILDLILDNQDWADWSEQMLAAYSRDHVLYINPIIYSEISISFQRIEELEDVIAQADFRMLALPKEVLFLAGKAFRQYRRNGSNRTSTLPDFFIGAQAAVMAIPLLTRDTGRYQTYFPTLNLITP